MIIVGEFHLTIKKTNYKQMKINHSIVTLLILQCMALFQSCTQSEYMIEPVGEKVPYTEEKKSITDELSASKMTLFLSAFEKSNLPDSLKNWENAPLTIFVPSDDAFEKVGLNKEAIDKMSAKQLDTLLLYHCMVTRFDTSAVKYTAGNIKITTKLNNPNLRTGWNTPYSYLHYVAINNNNLWINGKLSGTYHVQKTKEADIIYINRFLIKPTQDMWTILAADGRFSLFLQIIKANDLAYYNKNWAAAKMQPKLAVNSTVADYQANINLLSLFAPTDEAFVKAGYGDIENLRKLNDKNISNVGKYLYYKNGAPYDFRAFLKSDSILSYHSWAVRYYPTQNLSKPNATIFFSNELNNDRLANYVIYPYLSISVPEYVCPFVFSQREDGKTQIKLKNARESDEAATIIESDIMTLNGPIHVVDRLFIPRNF